MRTDPAPHKMSRETDTERLIHVLIVDDNPADSEFVAHCIRKIGSWSIQATSAASLQEALEMGPTEDFELLFIDYWLGAETGLAALKELRLAGVDLPTILMTGSRSEDVIVEALQAGVVDYIPKDAFGPAALQRAMLNAIEKADLSRSVRQKHYALLDSVARLEHRQEEIESFYHNVSHELKTPLTAAREFVALVLDGAFGALHEEQSDILEATLRNCDQMSVCVNDMLDATRLDTGKLSLAAEKNDICAIAEDVALSMRPRAEVMKIDIAVDSPAYEVLLDIDRQRIYQVLSNLVSNAVKFSPQGSRVQIIVDESSDETVEVRVIDRGCGIASNDEERVFDRLYQSSTEDAATLGGLGLGLYICREIIDLHGGRIFATSEPGKGSTFTFQLPRDSDVLVGSSRD